MDLLQSVWGVAEPLIAVATGTFAFLSWLRLRKVKKAEYATTTSEVVVVALEIGRPVSEAVKAAFGQLDELIQFEGTLKADEDYVLVTKRVHAALARHQGKKLKLVLSGPVGLSCLIGQLVGLHHFDIVVHQFDPVQKGYVALPVPDRTWLSHR